MDHALYLKLVPLLLKIPDIEDFATRTDLLIGLPNRASLQRNQANARTDISRLVDQLAEVRLQTGEWALSIVIENALARLEQTTTWGELAHLHQQILASMPRVASIGSVQSQAKGQRSTAPQQQAGRQVVEESIDHILGEGNREVCIIFDQGDMTTLRELKNHLRPLEARGIIRVWDSSQITAGMDWEQSIEDHFKTASIFLLLISANMMSSEEAYSLAKQALTKKVSSQVYVVPILVSAVDWEGSEFGGLNPLPANRKPIWNWSDRNEAYLDVVTGIRKIVAELALARSTGLPLYNNLY